MVIDETKERDVIKKVLLVILASAVVAQASAQGVGDYSTGSKWLWQVKSDHETVKIGATAFLLGMNELHWYGGLAGECVPTPDGATYGQVQALVINWLENNPDQRHLHMGIILHKAKREVWGSVSIPKDAPICS